MRVNFFSDARIFTFSQNFRKFSNKQNNYFPRSTVIILNAAIKRTKPTMASSPTTTTTTAGATATAMAKDAQRIIKALPGNDRCCDCNQTNPTWCSVSFCVLLCLECSGKHRGLGTHISFVRSLDMDSFTKNQIAMMKLGGNNKCNAFLQQKQQQQDPQPRHKYDNDRADLYKLTLKAQVEGKAIPSQLPRIHDSSSRHGSSSSSRSPPYMIFTNITPPPSVLHSIILAYKLLPLDLIMLDKVRDDRPWLYTLGLVVFGGLVAVQFVSTTTTASSIHTIQVLARGCLGLVGVMNFVWKPFQVASSIRNQRLASFKSSVNDYTQRCKAMRTKRNKGYELFFPPNISIGDSVEKALLFYPGILVDHMAYAMILGKLSDTGILIVLVNSEPSRICSEVATADEVQRMKHEITVLMDISVKEWIVGGHSLGGMVSSSLFIRKSTTNPSTAEAHSIRRLVQFATPDFYNLSSSKGLQSVLRVQGTCDGICAPFDNGIEYTKKKLPPDCEYKLECIEGGNHAGFAHYGPQVFPIPDLDRKAITLDQQQQQIIKVTSRYILGGK